MCKGEVQWWFTVVDPGFERGKKGGGGWGLRHILFCCTHFLDICTTFAYMTDFCGEKQKQNKKNHEGGRGGGGGRPIRAPGSATDFEAL